MVYTSRDYAKASPNVAGFIVMQTGHPTSFYGGVGESKSASIEAFALSVGRWCEILVGSIHAAEDFSGIPFLTEDKSHFMQAPPRWASKMRQGNGCVFIEELTTVQGDKRAGMLTMLSGRRLGDVTIHPDVWMVTAWNPVELAPNATPLEPSMANRFAHFKWVHDYEAWKQGMLSEDDNWGKSFIPVLPADWKRHKSDMGAAIMGYLDKNSNERIASKVGDEVISFGTPRSFHWCRDALAAAQSVNAPAAIQRQIACAFVGDVTGRGLMQYISQRDLVDPEEVLSGGKTFKHDPKRADLTVTLLTSVVTSIRQRYTGERMDAAVDLFCRNVGKDTADLVLTQLRHLASARPEGTTLSKQALAAMSEFGNRIKGMGK